MDRGIALTAVAKGLAVRKFPEALIARVVHDCPTIGTSGPTSSLEGSPVLSQLFAEGSRGCVTNVTAREAVVLSQQLPPFISS